MADRRRQIVQLLGARFDFDWMPGGSLRTSSGLAPNTRKPCPVCGHTDQPGWVVDVFRRRTPCVTCGGRIELDGRQKRGKGVVYVDRMDSHRQPVGTAEARPPARPARTVRCDACDGAGVVKGRRCVYCDGEGRRPLHVFDLTVNVRDEQQLDALTASIARRDQLGSFHELDLALAGISRQVNKPPRYLALTVNATHALRLLDDLYLPPTTRTDVSLSNFERSLVDLALDYIDQRMPDPIIVPADVRANERIQRERRTRARGRHVGTRALEQRDREIRKLAREGRPPQWIAGEYELSVAQVYRIVNSREAA